MKKIYLCGQVDKNGHFNGNLFAFSTLKKAESARDYYNNLLDTNSFVIETRIIDLLY